MMYFLCLFSDLMIHHQMLAVAYWVCKDVEPVDYNKILNDTAGVRMAPAVLPIYIRLIDKLRIVFLYFSLGIIVYI